MGNVTCYSAADFLALLQNLLPVGAAFPRDPTSVQTAFLQSLADIQYQTSEAACNLLPDVFPSTTVDFVNEWFETLGLPDPCWGPDVTLQEQQNAIVARLTATGGQSIPYLISFCTTLGFPNTTFEEFNCFRVGDRVGESLNGTQWVYALQVDNPTLKVYYFQPGIDDAGDYLSWTTDSALICELKRVIPGHVVLLLGYIAVYRIPGGGEVDTPLLVLPEV
jgi:uncharacterized protein YmfQ (DUF2313 family)